MNLFAWLLVFLAITGTDTDHHELDDTKDLDEEDPRNKFNELWDSVTGIYNKIYRKLSITCTLNLVTLSRKSY